jgi:hypothetical protein
MVLGDLKSYILDDKSEMPPFEYRQNGESDPM